MRQKQRISAVPFISQSEEQGFRVHPQAVELLRKASGDQQCSVLSMVGKAKKGKSYLLNHLLPLLSQQQAHSTQPFPVFDGIGAGTRGVSMLHFEAEGRRVILLDTEGLGSLDSSSQSEGKLFAVTLLLSSVMVYNNSGPLDLQSLQGLGVLAQVGKMIESSMGANEGKRLQPPSLVVALRDFALSLQTTSGQAITSRQYLQRALQEQKGTSNMTASKNSIKRVLKGVFKDRNCLTLSLPSEDLPITCKSELRQQFREELRCLAQVIREQLTAKPKSVNGKELTVDQWLNYASDVVSATSQCAKDGIKLQSLLFKVYRRQQGSVRENFCLKADSLLRKAEARGQQIMSLLDSAGRVDQLQLQESAERGLADLQRYQHQMQSCYKSACLQIEEMVRRQGGTMMAPLSLDYNHPDIASLKDFSQLYRLQKDKTEELTAISTRVKETFQEHLNDIEEKEQLARDQDKFRRVAEELSLSQTVREVEQKYMAFMRGVKQNGVSLDPQALEASFLKLEVVYLRRRIECSQREEERKTHCICPQQGILREKASNVEQNHPYPQKDKLFTLNSSSKELGPQDSKKSLLVPYLMLEEEEARVQILRTLIKQDSRGNSYAEYVLEVQLPGKKWAFNRRWKDFNELHNILTQLLPSQPLPAFSAGYLSVGSDCMGRQQQIEQRRSRLQAYTHQLLSLQQVRNSRIVQKFLKINKEYVPFL